VKCEYYIFALCLSGTAEQGVGDYSSPPEVQVGEGAKLNSKMKIFDRCLQGKVNKTTNIVPIVVNEIFLTLI
jgi:hypothetical protein